MEMDQVNISGSGRRAEFHQKSLRSVTRPRYSQAARTWRQKSRYAVASIRLCSPTKHAIQPISASGVRQEQLGKAAGWNSSASGKSCHEPLPDRNEMTAEPPQCMRDHAEPIS